MKDKMEVRYKPAIIETVRQLNALAIECNVNEKVKKQSVKKYATAKGEPANGPKESHNILPTRQQCDIIERFGDYNSSLRESIVDSDSRNYTVKELLGKGGFAKVYRLTCAANPQSDMAAKIISKRTLTRPEKKDKVAREIDIQQRMKHKNVVQFMKYFEDQSFVFIVLEYCGFKTLSSILRVRKRLTEPEVRYYLQQLIAGTKHIHSKGVVHRDLKLSNIFINEEMVLKIGDFGLSAFLKNANEKKESICGTPNYISPEVIKKCGHSYPADVWAVGCIVYALLSGRPPFETQNLKDTYNLISKGKYSEPMHASVNARRLVSQCLRVEPLQRPSMPELERFPFLANGFIPAKLPETATCSDPEIIEPVGLRMDYLDTNGNRVIGAVEYYVETIDKQEIAAEGGKNSPQVMHSSILECNFLLNAMRLTFQRIQDMPNGENPRPAGADDCIWITKWVDYSHKYGFGFQLSNDVYGASYKGGFSIAVSGDERQVGVHDPEGGLTVECDAVDLPLTFRRKLQVLKYFVKYMDDTLIKGGESNMAGVSIAEKSECIQRNELSKVYILRWLRTRECIIMLLSTGTVQVNFFHDHTKLVISRVESDEYNLMYINSKRVSSVYKLTEIAKYGISNDIKVRFHYALLQLDNILRKYN